MGEVRITLLGYICINPDDKEDTRVFTSLEELLNKKNMEDKPTILGSTSIDAQRLPIIDETLLATRKVKFPLEDNSGNNWRVKKKPNQCEAPTESGLIRWKCKPVQIFRDTFLNSRLNADFQEKYSVPVCTSRTVLKELLTRLAVASGTSNANKRFDSNRYHSDFRLVKDKKDSLVMYHDSDKLHTKFEGKGLDVENYLTNRKDGDKCYQVFSIHVLFHQGSKTHFIYPAQVDGFIYDKTANILTPVEIKCVKDKITYIGRNFQVKYLQAALGQVTKMVFAYYNNFTDSSGVERWTISHFEPEDVPENRKFPEYGNDRILLLSKLLEYNKNIPSFLTVIENANGDVLKIRFASAVYEEEMAIDCVLGKCKHGKSNPNATATSVRKCRKNLNKWIAKLGESDLNSRTTFSYD